MDAFLQPNRPVRGLRTALLALAVIVLAACSAGGGSSPAVGTTPGTPTAGTSSAPVASAPAAPSVAVAPSAASFPDTVTDAEGTEVTIEAEPQVIVSLTPATTETLFALGVGDRIAGKGEDVFLYPPEAADIPDVARFDGVDVERIVALEPDVVFAGGNFFTAPDAITRLRELGFPVVVTYAATVDDVYRDIELTGDAVGRGAEARAITQRIRDEFARVAAAVAGAPRPRVFYELDATGAIYGPADDSFIAEMIEVAGGQPITTGSPEAFEIPLERLIEADPELILLADAPYGVTPEQVAARPGWDVMTAVRTEGGIRPIDDQTVTRPGPRLFLGLQLLARTIHPELDIPSSEPIPAVPAG